MWVVDLSAAIFEEKHLQFSTLETFVRTDLASFPGLPRFYLPFAFTIIHRSGIPKIVNANKRSKRGRPGTESRTDLSQWLT